MPLKQALDSTRFLLDSLTTMSHQNCPLTKGEMDALEVLVAHASQQAVIGNGAAVTNELIAELEAEANSWWQGKKPTTLKRAAAQGALTIIAKLRERLAAAPGTPK